MLTEILRARGLRPVGELAANRLHGDRLRYLAGCKCTDCRKANSRYESQRQAARRAGDWNGIVSAKRARRHILKLSRIGVGRRAIAAASDVGETTIQEVRSRKKLHIRARTERRILDVTPDMISDRALVPAGALWKRIGHLLEEGYTKRRIAQLLGYSSPALQFKKAKVTARSDYDIAQLFQRLMT